MSLQHIANATAMADVPDSKSGTCNGEVGSSPTFGTDDSRWIAPSLIARPPSNVTNATARPVSMSGDDALRRRLSSGILCSRCRSSQRPTALATVPSRIVGRKG